LNVDSILQKLIVFYHYIDFVEWYIDVLTFISGYEICKKYIYIIKYI